MTAIRAGASLVVVLCLTVAACGRPERAPATPAAAVPTIPPSQPPSPLLPETTLAPSAPPTTVPGPATNTCGGAPLRVHFYDVAQALSALVDLPDGRHILVDTGDSATQPGCGATCKTAHAHLVSQLTTDLNSSPINLLWITHQHADHIGGAIDLMTKFSIEQYVDNGRDLTVSEIKKTRAEATAKDIPITVESPDSASMPIADGKDVKLTAIVPSGWPSDCEADRNECSILLRIDYCSSSVLFVGDAETEEEGLLDPHGPATLLQVGHHGSDTSSSAAFLAKVQPKYAVISAGKPGEGMNRTCTGDPRVRREGRVQGQRGDALDRRASERSPVGYRARRGRRAVDHGERRVHA